MTEILDIVNEKDEVIGQKTRKEVHSSNLVHRGAHVFVFNSRGEILLQKRSLKKDKYPGFWGDMAGHIDSGENYEESARRELKEELGIEAKLEFFMKFRKHFENDQEIITVFKCVHDGPIKIDREEIDEVKFFSPEEIRNMLESGEKIAPGARIALEEWLKEAEKG